jgi:RimJ/RimL family protein N-acetyltransferase
MENKFTLNMVALNFALEIDLTGQATSESIGNMLYSGIGGFQDFMRGARLARNGKSILVLKSTALNETVSRIVPTLSNAAGVTLTRADVRYVVTEYGIAFLHGKNIRERAMSLIAIAHPKFRPWLIEEAKKRDIIYKDQAFMPGEKGRYPEHLETIKTTKYGEILFLRPVKISDEDLLKDFFHAMSDKNIHQRFFSWRTDMPHDRLQEYVVIDYTKEMSILAIIGYPENEIVVGLGQYQANESMHTAALALAVRDDYQNRGICGEILAYLSYIANRDGFLGFTADVLAENKSMIHIFEHSNFEIASQLQSGIYHFELNFKTRKDR